MSSEGGGTYQWAVRPGKLLVGSAFITVHGGGTGVTSSSSVISFVLLALCLVMGGVEGVSCQMPVGSQRW